MPSKHKPCTRPGCPHVLAKGPCPDHARQAEARRGTSAQRGYSGTDWVKVRAEVKARDPVCTVCHHRPTVTADHHPEPRKALIAQGVHDPDALHRLRGVCWPCHSIETAEHQPGGWHAR